MIQLPSDISPELRMFLEELYERIQLLEQQVEQQIVAIEKLKDELK
jgi:hypothetical protein